MSISKSLSFHSAFTVIELLVVIVIIGILSSLAFVSFVGVSQKAIASTLKSDLASATTKLKIYKVDHDGYPTANNCAITPSVPPNICLKSSPGNSLSYEPAAGPNPQTYTLTASRIGHPDMTYRSTESTPPTLVVLTPIAAITDISGTTQVDSILTAGATTPAEATVSYQWQRADTVSGSYAPISGATSNTYTLVPGDATKYIKVTVTGISDYSGVLTSAARGPVTAGATFETVNGTAFVGNNPWTGTASWGAEYDGDSWDNYALELTSTFNLAAYSNGTISNVTLLWNYSGTGGTNGSYKYIKQGVTPFATLYTTPAENYISSYNGSNLTTYVNSKKGTTCKIDWKSDYGDAGDDIWGVQNNMSTPRLTFTWTPS